MSRYFQRLLQTERDWATAVLRVTLGVMILPHGAQKLFGWFGGFGLGPTLDYFASTLGLPVLVGALVIVAEFFGGVGLITGLLTRASALGVAAVMLGAVVVGGHIDNGFFMNWTGAQAGEGFELHLLAVGIAAALVLKGAGAWSLDRLITQRVRARRGVEVPVRRREREPVAA